MTGPFRKFIPVCFWRPDKALAIAYWRATGRRVRARVRLDDAVARLPFAYERWLESLARSDRKALAGSGNREPVIAIHIHRSAHVTDDDLARAVTSVRRQRWPHWRLLVTCHDGSIGRLPKGRRIEAIDGRFSSATAALRAALERARESGSDGIPPAEYLVPLLPGCLLPASALEAYATQPVAPAGAQDNPILYGDQDEAGPAGRRGNPWLKPDWDPEMFLSQDYLSAACALPAAAGHRAAQEPGIPDTADPAVAVYGLILGMAGQAVRHLHRVTASTPPGYWRRPSGERQALVRAMRPDLHVTKGPFGTLSIRHPLPDPTPLVSIIIPTRDRLDLLQTCVEGVLGQTRYPAFEIIIADNGSVEAQTLEYLRAIASDPRVRVVAWPHPYNYSAINNFAARSARGSYLCLLNNDVEIIDGDWLCALMRQAVRPDAGAVGARLLYPDRSIQHAGVVVGMGNAAGHAHRGLPDGAPGYFAQALVNRGATAVTAACLVVEKSKFEHVGGLDEAALAIAYNDVDLCLKLQRAGARNYYVAASRLIHHESKSRGLDMAPEHRERYMAELAVFQARWGTIGFIDPWHHPALDRQSEHYRGAFPI